MSEKGGGYLLGGRKGGGGEKPINLSLPGMITVRHFTQSVAQTSLFKGSDIIHFSKNILMSCFKNMQPYLSNLLLLVTFYDVIIFYCCDF